jgi:hypothetical protein
MAMIDDGNARVAAAKAPRCERARRPAASGTGALSLPVGIVA